MHRQRSKNGAMLSWRWSRGVSEVNEGVWETHQSRSPNLADGHNTDNNYQKNRCTNPHRERNSQSGMVLSSPSHFWNSLLVPACFSDTA